jgi:hypothetical protein
MLRNGVFMIVFSSQIVRQGCRDDGMTPDPGENRHGSRRRPSFNWGRSVTASFREHEIWRLPPASPEPGSSQCDADRSGEARAVKLWASSLLLSGALDEARRAVDPVLSDRP